MVAPPDTTPAANIPASFRQSGSFAVNALEVVPGQSVPGTSSAPQPVPSSSVETTQNSPTQNSPTQSSLTQNSPTSNSPTQNSSTQNSPSLPSPTTGGSEPSKTSETVSSSASSFATVTITASADTSSKSTSSATAGAIAGGLTGSLAVIILIVFLIRRCHRRSGRTPFRSKPGPSAGIEPYMFASSTESSTGSIGTQSRSTTGLGIFSRISSRFSSLTEKGIFASSSADQDRRTGDIPQTRQQERSSIEKIAHDAMGLADVPALRDLNGSRRRGERDGDDESMNEAPPSYSSHYDSL
ncbi:hypothetical protein K435DRAFT_189235 [Dendrothele bispora CBS 962.96]|uniref:Mid2 domain-containing protein n=1 Tax=Dendrothele bispora (strain CBS 962.96) TaxID=1314807 RepID=A0A4V6T5C7_DENBC|nr:hypothetical protein K435DRAFT_189235 [Dendrothele bispora CBS 962.96]